MNLLNPDYLAMERDELVRLAGEQALLSKDVQKLSAEQNRDMQTLRNLPNDIGRTTGWRDRGVELLNRMHERETEIATARHRLREYAKMTGIN